MCADAASPVVVGPSPSQPHDHLPIHCRQLASPASSMPVVPSVPTSNPNVLKEDPSVALQQPNQSKPNKSTQSNIETSAITQISRPSVTPSPKLQSKPTPTKTPGTCEGCSRPHDGSYGSGRFCSVHCARRIAASRKWEKQRSQRKRSAAAAATAVAAAVDHSTSSLSSASSEDHATRKRQRVMVMQGMMPTHHIVHHPNLIHPQPQHFQRPFSFSGMAPHPYPPGASPLSATTPTPPPPPPHHNMTSYVDYPGVVSRAVTPVQYHSAPYQYHASPVTYASTPPPYPIYPSPTPQHLPPPPPPPTPAQEILTRFSAPLTSAYMHNYQQAVQPKVAHAQQGVLSSERECEAVAEALLCLRTSSKTD